MKLWTGALVSAVALISAGNAIACPPPPPGPPPEAGESAESHAARVAAFQAAQEAQHQAWLLQREQRNWDEADSVFLARVERVRVSTLEYLGETPRVTLRPVRVLKGQRSRARFDLRYEEMTSCGPIPAFDAIQGNVGDTFVVFVRGRRPHQSTVQLTVAPAAVLDPRVRAALDATP